MIGSYFKIMFRNLSRNKTFSIINIFGLALGLVCSLLILLWVQDERSVDAFHKNKKNLFQVYERIYMDGKQNADYHTQGLLAQELKKYFPEIEYASGFDEPMYNILASDKKVNKLLGSFAGNDFFKMFSYPLLEGKAESALSSPESVAISRSTAEYFFGSADRAIGKTLRLEKTQDLKVTAVFENIPSQSSIQFDFLRGWDAFVKENDWVHHWGNRSPSTFVQLRDKSDPYKLGSKIKDFISRYEPLRENFYFELLLQPYSERWLHSAFKEGNIVGGRIEYVRLFTIVALFILLIGCINFMNLATAGATRRSKEIGLKKVIGANKSRLVLQFIGEALFLTLIAIVIAFITCSLVLPGFNSLTGKQLILPVTNVTFWLAIGGLFLVTGLVSGSYPAFFLSSVNPIGVIKGNLKFKWSATWLRKGLVVFQFSLSIILIVGMIVMYRQVNFIHTKNIGYDRENLVYIPIEGALVSKYEIFKEMTGREPSILSVSKMRNSPTYIEHHTGDFNWPGKDPNMNLSFADGVVGYDFVKTLKLQLKDGRDFSKDYGTDSVGFLINETAADWIGMDDPVGKTFFWGQHQGRIIGVLKDFHFASMHNKIDPLIIRLDENWGWGTILVRTKAGKTREAIAGLEKICKQLNSDYPFTYQFSDQEFDKLYKSESIVTKLSGYFAALAIFISCLGLFGLATFAAAQRTKEIGVRKVLGASIPGIISMLSGSFLKLVLIAILVAFPISWFIMNQWLQDFAYKIELDWWIFAGAGVLSCLVALLTVGYQSIKAATINPVNSLRSE